MSRRGVASAAALAVAALSSALLTSPLTTQAGWREEMTVSIADGRSDGFGFSATDATNLVDHRGSVPGDIANEPAVSIKNLSTTQTSWIDVVSTRVSVPASNTSSTLLNNVRVAYDPTTSDCLSGASGSTYWSVNAGSAVASGTTYSRTWAAVLGDDLTPGQTKSLCPVVTRSGTDVDFLLAHGGRQLDIATQVRQRTKDPATGSSPTVLVTSRYQVKLPPPTRPSWDSVVCARTGSAGNRTNLLWGKVYWAWPFAANSGGSSGATVTTPAVDRFVLIRSVDGVTNWAPFRQSNDQVSGSLYSTPGNSRESVVINSNHLNNDTDVPVWLSVRAYPFTGTSVYVDADWKVKIGEVGDRIGCYTGTTEGSTSVGELTSPTPTPVGLG